MPPLSPMLAKSARTLPFTDDVDGGFVFEPKWDGFRAIVFRDGSDVEILSRSGKSLVKYFPELVVSLRQQLPVRCVLDGEIVIERHGRLDFDALSARIHPAVTRINKMAQDFPAMFIAFDLLALESEDLMDRPFDERRSALVVAMSGASAPIYLTRASSDRGEAERWFNLFEGAGLDGVMAKPVNSAYQPGKRTMLKIKHSRSADVVVAGYRLHRNSTPQKPLLGSLLVGLYSNSGQLQHVGVCAAFTAARRSELIDELAYLVDDTGDHPWLQPEDETSSARIPGSRNRWNGAKDLSFVALRPELVAEVGYEHMEGEGDNARFRHSAQFRRWRDDRDPSSCTYDQLEEVVSYELSDILIG